MMVVPGFTSMKLVITQWFVFWTWQPTSPEGIPDAANKPDPIEA